MLGRHRGFAQCTAVGCTSDSWVRRRSLDMSVAIITGSAGIVGSEALAYFAALGMGLVGIDNGMRGEFFGQEAST
jgi:hypothetical protein